jgi:AcrR family transcriptional regulator
MVHFTAMARSPSQNAALRIATHDRLVHAAMACFAEQGFATVTVRDIAARAELSVGVLYRHFHGKDALLLAAFERSMTEVRATFDEAMAASPQARLGVLVRAAAATVRDHLAFWQLGYAARHQPAVIGALGEALTSWTREIVAVLTALLREAGCGEPELEALALFAQIDGMCEHYALAPLTYPLDAVVECIIAQRDARPSTV